MPPADVTRLLPEENKAALMAVPGRLREVREWCRLCREAGLDMSEHEERAAKLETLANGLIRTFVNPRRRG